MSLSYTDRKAVRLVQKGQVWISHRSPDVLQGTVVGESGHTYLVSVDPEGGHCDHPAVLELGFEEARTCSHIRALELAYAYELEGSQ